MTTLDARWKHGEGAGAGVVAYVGDVRPTQLVEVRLGNFTRGFAPWAHPVDAVIYGESKSRPWQATWTPRTPWVALPNIAQVDLTQDYESNGIAVATIELENVVFVQQAGALGDLYHVIDRGHLSPFRGSVRDLPAPDRRYDVPSNQWRNYLTKNAQVRVWQGYGDVLEPTFMGMVDDVDLTSHPDHITITARDFGQVLTDEHVFGWVKSRQLPEPTSFRTVGKSKDPAVGVGYDAAASTSRDGHLPRFVVDASTTSQWISHDHSTEDNTEWVQVRLPRGRYDSFAIHPGYPGMEVYAAVYAHSTGLGGKKCRLDGAPIDDGWVAVGNGLVPGGNGGYPWLRRWGSMAERGASHKLGHSLELGEGSILRIAFRNLYRVGDAYRASCVRLAGVKRTTRLGAKAPKPSKVIACDDVADVVRVVLRWAGFKEWEVTDTGAQLKARWTFNRQNTLMDVIQKCMDATGYVFYVKPPTADNPDSLGIPVFAPNYSVKNLAGGKTVTDHDLLTGIQVKATDEPLSYIIRIRGAGAKKGATLGMDAARKAMAVYRPPWTRNLRLAGVIKHFVADADNDPQLKNLKTDDECMVVAQLVALQMALQAYTAEIEVPGNPSFDLNEQARLFDVGTGLNTRLYIARRSSSFVAGEQATYKTTLGGALIDVDDVREVIADLQATLRRMGKSTRRVEIGDAFFMEID